MTDEEIVKRAKEAEKRTRFGELVHSPVSNGVNSAYGIGFIEGMVEYRNSLQEKEEQFEKNRLAHCDALTAEQAQIESDFVTRHIQENNRTPTFIDAIEYGMRLQKEQMMTYAVDGAFIRRNRYTKKNVLHGLDTTCDAIQSFKDKDKIKVLFIKD